ncbi:hypothetical protein R1flu_011832 [Riccia fluitans]|uniref:Uncharacterized protein n=1 Tax=Riccia fluitans TaxID=41844 RepID=A0ABD1Z947_9MARC
MSPIVDMERVDKFVDVEVQVVTHAPVMRGLDALLGAKNIKTLVELMESAASERLWEKICIKMEGKMKEMEDKVSSSFKSRLEDISQKFPSQSSTPTPTSSTPICSSQLDWTPMLLNAPTCKKIKLEVDKDGELTSNE